MLSKFLDSDAWLLATVFWAHRAMSRVTLDEIVSYGDALNHCIFNFDEIAGGLSRLSAADVLREDNGAITPTDAAATLYQEFNRLPLKTIESVGWFSQKL